MSFMDILNRPATEIEPPKPLPVGSYIATITGMPNAVKVGAAETDAYDFPAKIVAPGEDVDPDALKDWSGKSGKPVQGANAPRLRFFLTEDAVYRLKDFLKACGIDVDNKKKTLAELINEVPGRQVMIHVKHRPFTRQGSTEMEIAAEVGSYSLTA